MRVVRVVLLCTTIAAVINVTGKADTIAASLFSPPLGTDPTLIDLSGITPPSQAPVTGTGYSIAFTGAGAGEGVVKGSIAAVRAVPVAGVTAGNPEYLTGGFGSALTTNIDSSGNYLSTGTGTITITFSTPETALALLWGSIDTGNSLTLNDAGNFAITGTDVQNAAAGFVGNGFQGPGGSAYVIVNTSTPFTTVTVSSSVVSLELAGIAAADTPFTFVPEPTRITLFGAGLALLSIFVARHRRSER
jgi:hypothetical protein